MLKTQNLSRTLDDKGPPNAVGGRSSEGEDAGFQYCRYCGSKILLSSTLCPYCGRGQLTQQPQTLVGERERFRGYIVRNLRAMRVAVFLLCMGVFVAGLLVGSQTSLSTEEAELIIDELRRIITSGSFTLQIAQNNIILCLLFFLPMLGVLLMAFVSYSTGIVISAYALLSTSTTSSEILQSFFLFPTTWLELIAYSLAASEGLLLLLGVLTRRLREEGKNLAKTVLLCVTLLMISAVIESILVLA